ncbi:MAG: hypothetical protein Q8Q75_13375, partial [Rhodoferax sp.]|nr:hypothetical protein [Rhodoferax sp.]
MSTEPTPLVLPTRAVRPAMPATFEPAPDAPLQLPDTNYHAVLRRGRWLLALGFGGFLAFAVLAPLDEGVPAPGVVAVESTRKRIDHLNGGL